MTTPFRALSADIQQLGRALTVLIGKAGEIGVASPSDEGWHELLRHKLLPQAESEPLLVVGVVGGTNIGKSVLFNHLAGEVASGVSALAAGTKHPVCLVPPGMDDPQALGRLFDGFELRPWQSSEDPLGECDAHLLFWRVGEHVPPRLLLLDAPDVDSDAKVNWHRARLIRQSADVLIAVLTQQKYNDAAVKQFFREAVEADKPIVIVFNQCDATEDRHFWPQWLATFVAETGAEPDLVYVVPYDRAASHALRLPFYSVGRDGHTPPAEPSSLRAELAAMRFDEIKIRTFRGALARVLDPVDGAPSWLARIRAAAGEYEAAHRALTATEMARVAWPTLPAGVLVDEIRDWWDAARSPWSRNIHGFYRMLGEGVMWPIRKAWETRGASSQPVVTFRQRERDAILLAVEKMLDELERLSQVGNDTLRPYLLGLLGGNAREQLLVRVRQAHKELPAVDDDYRTFLRLELDAWRDTRPGAVTFLRSLDNAMAIARPAITISLVVSGWVVAGDLVGQAAVQAAGHTVGNLATEAAITGGIAGGGEALVSSTSEGVRQAAGRLFNRLQSRYAQQRAAWLAAWLENELLGELLSELHRGAELPQSAPFRRVEETVARLRSGVAGIAATPSG
ncbi:MAG: hypothetical protein GXY83_12580 [Rhodopirellula sp.]|nr:hypothetical protein [Rhodopirellula sp.]